MYLFIIILIMLIISLIGCTFKCHL